MNKKIDVFETLREFKQRFPVEIYVCSRCKKLTKNPYVCEECGQQSRNLFEEFDENYKFIIKEQGEEIHSIFKPIEPKKGLKDEREQ